MGIRLEILLDALGNSHSFQYVGNNGVSIYAVQILQEIWQLQSNVLYIASRDTIQPTGIPWGISTIFVEENAIVAVYDHLQRILVQALKQEFSLMSLKNALLSGENPQGFTNICAELLGNPCILFDQALQPITASASLTEEQELYNGLIHLIHTIQIPQENKPVCLDCDPIHNRRMLACFLPLGCANVRCILFVETIRPFSSLDLYFAQEACHILLPAFSIASDNDEPVEKLFVDLLENRYLSPYALEELNKAFQIHKNHTVIYLLLVDTTFQKEKMMMLETLSHIVGRKIIRYHHYYATLLSCSASDSITYNTIPGFMGFLEEHRLFASLSNGYSDLKKTASALNQCKEILKIGYSIRKTQHFFLFEDQMIYYMFDMLDDKDILMDMIHPVVRQVYEYDQQRQTDYLRTLGAYILLEKSTQRCADALYIHRNTMVHRIDKLKTLFNIDFSDSRMRTKLHMSVLIYGYLGLVDLFVQPLTTETDPFL